MEENNKKEKKIDYLWIKFWIYIFIFCLFLNLKRCQEKKKKQPTQEEQQ